MLVPEYSYSTILPADADKNSIEIIPDVPEEIDAPVTEGQVIGKAQIQYNGQSLATINLVASETLERSELVYGATIIKNVITSPWFIGVAVLVLVLFVIYLVLVSVIGKNKKGNVKKHRDL